MTATLRSLVERTGVTPDDHLVLDDIIPVLDAIQAQGDVIAVPNSNVATSSARWIDLPRGGVTLVEGVHPHVLDADPGVCRYTTDVEDETDLTVAVVVNTAPVYLLHPEHGGTGLAPGTWSIRRQREMASEQRLVAD